MLNLAQFCPGEIGWTKKRYYFESSFLEIVFKIKNSCGEINKKSYPFIQQLLPNVHT